MNYLVLKEIHIENANAISGFTYGFPAVTHFLGFVHALSRKAQRSEFGFSMGACAIICHDHQVQAYRENPYEPYGFALTRNPLTKEGKTAPIVEEGRMHLTVSLVIECEGLDRFTDEKEKAQCQFVKELAHTHKLAGGRINMIKACYIDTTDCHKKLLRKLLPGFILADRSAYLAQINTEKPQTPLHNWLDFISLRFIATDKVLAGEEEKNIEPQKVEWQKQTHGFEGYLVPLQVGYKKIANTFEAGEVVNARDNTSPFSFVESVHSIGEWIGSPSKINSLQEVLWQYSYQDPYYLCQTQSQLDDNDDEFIEDDY